MSNRRIREMTDIALMEAVKRLPWEKRVESIGCGAAVPVGIAAAAFLRFRLRGEVSFADVLFVGVFYAVVVMLVGMGIAAFRGRPYTRELRRRFGEGAFAERLKGAVCWLAEPEPPEWIVLLDGWGLPYGNLVQIDLKLDGSGAGRLEVRVSHHERDNPTTGRMQINESESAPLMEVLRSLDLKPLIDLFPTVIDGFPCDVGVIHRGTNGAMRAHCNLTGIPPDKKDSPTARVAALTYALASLAMDSPVSVGFTDSEGNIGIGTL